MALSLSELVRAVEFAAEFGGAEVFAQVGEALFQGVEGLGDGFGVGVGHVAPHAVGAGAEAGHLSQGAATDGVEFGCAAYFVLKESGESCRQKLRQVADPGHELVVAGGVEVEDAAAEASGPLPPLGGERGGLRRHLGWFAIGAGLLGGEDPGRAGEDGGVGVGRAADFFAGHGVAGEEAGFAWLVEVAVPRGGDDGFGAAHIGDELCGREDAGELLHEVEDGVDGRREQDELAGACGGQRRWSDGIDRARSQRGLGLLGATVPADDLAGEPGRAQGQACGGSQQACAENGDALQRFGHLYGSSHRWGDHPQLVHQLGELVGEERLGGV